MEDKIYCQWNPYRFRSGYCVVNPTDSEVEKFYEVVRASDPYHQTFVIVIPNDSNLHIQEVDEYIRRNILPYFFGNK